MKQLYADSIRHICRNEYDEMQIKVWSSSADNEEPWLSLIRDQFVILAEIESKIVGFGTLKDGSYIDLFYIHKDFQKQGIAQKILMKLEDESRRKNIKTLSGDISITAKPFFEKNGFKVIAEQRNIKKNVELVNYKMVKKLTRPQT